MMLMSYPIQFHLTILKNSYQMTRKTVLYKGLNIAWLLLIVSFTVVSPQDIPARPVPPTTCK